jgi:hypothetical protein
LSKINSAPELRRIGFTRRLHEMSNISRVPSAIEAGELAASARLLPLVYEELRRLAARKLAHEPSGLTLSPTDLVREAYLKKFRNSVRSSPTEHAWE